MNIGLKLEAWVMSRVTLYAPLVTPSGKLGKVGTVVATMVLPGGATQQWMCAAIVPLVRPLKTTLTWSWFVRVSISTTPEPSAGDPFGGFSLAPLKLKGKRNVEAWATDPPKAPSIAGASPRIAAATMS